MKKRIKQDWVFEKSNLGTLVGINDAGTITFTGGKGGVITHIVRETVQEAIDARLDRSRPSEIEFCCYSCPMVDLPGQQTLRQYVDNGIDLWSRIGNDKTKKFFECARNILKQQKINVLRISDFNTKGITGSDLPFGGPFNALVRSTGVSDKPDGAGGSNGLGSNAVFSGSSLRTVVYSTFDIENKKATLGVNGMPSSIMDGVCTSGKGYFGENNAVIRDCVSFDPTFKRDRQGTDIFCLGFFSCQDFKKDFIVAVIDNYIVPLVLGDLIVRINDTEINQLTIKKLIQDYHDDLADASSYYMALTDPKSEVLDFDVNGLPDVRLYLSRRPGLNRRILMCRKTGVKVLEKGNYPSHLSFSGVCVLHDELNKKFRLMEDPTHSTWDPERLQFKDEIKEAKALNHALFAKVKEHVIGDSTFVDADSVDIIGLNDFFPDVENVVGSMICKEQGEIKIRSRPPWSSAKSGGQNKSIACFPLQSIKPKERVQTVVSNQKVLCINDDVQTRIIPIDESKYQYCLIIEPKRSAKNCYVTLSVCGEQESEVIEVKSAFDDNNDGHNYEIERGGIMIGNLDKIKNRILFEAEFDSDLTLGVTVYGEI